MKIKFKIGGMTCAACSARVEKVSSSVSGVDHAEVNLLAGTLIVEADSEAITPTLISEIEKAGYHASVYGASAKIEKNSDDPLKAMVIRFAFSAAILLVLMFFTMGHMLEIPMPAWYCGTENALLAALLQFFLALPVILLNVGYYIRGFKALWHRAPNMDSLIAVGSGAALVYGIVALFIMSYSLGHGDMETVSRYSGQLYFESAAMILTLISLGKILETRAKGKTGEAIKRLMDLSPKTACVLVDGTEKIVSVEQVKVGDIVVVRAGGSIPVDGTVISGRGTVDESLLTGESVPVEKSEGAFVSAATINTEGYLKIRTDKTGEDTTLSQVIHFVEQAGGSKAPIARLADKIAGVFVPVVMLIALVTFVIWLVAGFGIAFALTNAIAVLVISCPCALGLATPVAIMVGTGRGAGMGVLFKNAESLENLHKIDTVVLDKTGTLTTGKPEVTDILPAGADKDTLVCIAASLEGKSEHPFAKAIIKYACNREIPVCDDFQTIPGKGVCGVVNGIRYYGGNQSLMVEIGVVVPDFAELSGVGKTPLYFADQQGNYLGAIIAADVLKSDSAWAVSRLRALGLQVVMLSGDNHNTATAIARAAGIEEVIAGVLPCNKAEEIGKLHQKGHRVLMVGDGINDAPALVIADVGMAIGAGTDIAIESADVVLMHDTLVGAYNAICLSKATIRNIKQNLFWAFFYNCLGIPVAAGVLYPAFGLLLNPMIGAAAMSFSSVFVVTNALRLRLFKADFAPMKSVDDKDQIIMEDNHMEIVIKVEGMMCTHCQARVESVCKGIEGVASAVVDLQAKQVTVTGKFDAAQVKAAIKNAGYEVIEG